MAQYRIYLTEEVDQALKRHAKRVGLEPKKAIEALVADIAHEQKLAAIGEQIARHCVAMEGVANLLDLIGTEVGFVGGVARASVKSSEAAAAAARTREGELRWAIETVMAAIRNPIPTSGVASNDA